jgi:hypothetical protein
MGVSTSGVNHLIFNSHAGVRKVKVHIMNHYMESKKGRNIHKKQEIKVEVSM